MKKIIFTEVKTKSKLMMSFITFMILISVSVILTSSLLIAQPPEPPCEMDCLPQYPWIPYATQSFDLDTINCPGCKIAFVFWYRPNACGLFKDLQLGQIYLSPQCTTCSYTLTEIVNFAKDKMIRYHGKWQMPGQDTCETNWRAFISGCWGEWQQGDSTVIKPCEPSQCCWERIRVCGIGNNEIEYTVTGYYHPDPNICFFYPYPCEFTCEEAPEPPKSGSESQESFNPINGFSVLSYPNPANTQITMFFESDEQGNYVLEIHDILGNRLLREPFTKTSEAIYIQLNLENYSSGTYNYSINFKGEVSLTGSFNVQR